MTLFNIHQSMENIPVEIHPHANLFPMCSDEEIQELAADISKNGLRQPIVIDDDEMILDGRNRAAACAIAQVEPVYEPFPGTDSEKLAYVVSVNIHRRHLTTAQRAEIAASIATMSVGENQHTARKKKEGGSNDPPTESISTKQAAEMLNVSPSSVKRAKAAAKTPEREQQTVTPPEPARKRTLTIKQIDSALLSMSKVKKRQPQLEQVATAAMHLMTRERRTEWLVTEMARLPKEDRVGVYDRVNSQPAATAD